MNVSECASRWSENTTTFGRGLNMELPVLTLSSAIAVPHTVICFVRMPTPPPECPQCSVRKFGDGREHGYESRCRRPMICRLVFVHQYSWAGCGGIFDELWKRP